MNPLHSFLGKSSSRKSKTIRKGNKFRPSLEPLDDRITPTHFRYGNLSWEPTTGNTVDFHLQAAFRSGYGTVSVGSIITETIGNTSLSFGDSVNTGTLNFRVLSINTADDYLVAEAVRNTGTTASPVWTEGILHTYATAKNFTASVASSARISTLQNNANGNYRLETVVNVATGNKSPVSSLAPIIQMPDNAINTFQIPAVDPNGDTLTYRLATPTEMGRSTLVQPTGFTVSSTGLVSWDIRNSVLVTVPNDLWTAQIIVEDRTAAGVVKTKTPLDFILKITPEVAANKPPTVVASPTGPFQPVANSVLTFNINATDTDGTITNLQALNAPTGMTFTLFGSPAATKTITATWTPTQSQSGQSFVVTFQATDNSGAQSQTSVTITPSANQAPVANNDAYSVNEDAVLTVAAPGVRGNDTDAEGNPFTAALVATTTHGSLNFNADGSFTYTPVANYNGPDSFTYRNSDATGTGNTATVNITVNPVNDPPVAVGDAYTTPEDTPLTLTLPQSVLANDTDIDGNTLTAIRVTNPANGSLTLNPNGTFTYTPASNFNGIDTFTYKANDGAADSNTVTVTITVTAVNDTPIVNNDSAVTNEDTAVVIPVLANDTPGPANESGQTLTVTKLNGTTVAVGQTVATTHGTVVLNADGTVTYTPALNYNGPDSFSYQATDNGTPNLSASASGLVTINPVNDAPVAVNDSYTIAEDNTLTVSAANGILKNDTDVDANPLTVASPRPIIAPAHGNVTINADGSFVYTPFANYNGTDTFTYKANDGIVDSGVATVTITITPVNDPPVAANDTAITDEDVPIAITVLGNDTDVDGTVNPASVVVTQNPAHGSVTVNPTTGVVTYTPAPNYNGSDNFKYTVKDDTGATSAPATVTITVNPVNDPPVTNPDNYSVDEDTTLTVAAVGVLGNDTDADNDPLQAVIVSTTTYGSLVFNTNGSFVYTPNSNYNGPDSFTYKAFDGVANGNTVTVSITVKPVNDAPAITANNDDDLIVDEGLTAVNAGNYSDIDAGDTVTVTASIGTITQSGGIWSWSYNTVDGPAQSQVVTVTATDAAGAQTVATFNLVVVNVPPVIDSLSATSVFENGTVILSGTYHDAGALDTHTLTINWGEGALQVVAVSGGTFSVTHKYLDDNPTGTSSDVYTIGVTLTDKDGGSTTGSTTSTVTNVAPTFDPGANATILPVLAGLFSRTGIAFTDPGTQDVWSGTVDYGDGTGSQPLVVDSINKKFDLSHTYTTPGTFAVTVTLNDDDLGQTVRGLSVGVILNNPPTVTVNNASVITPEGTPGTNTGTFSDPQGNATVTLTANIGTVVQNNGTGTWSWSAPAADDLAPTTVTITATDNYGATATATFAYAITNMAPTLGTVSATSVNENGTVTLTGTYSDPGVLDTHTLTINWGEGAPQVVAVSGGTFSVTHKYLDDNPTNTASDVYGIGVTLTDDNGGTAAGSTTTTITNVAPVLNTLTATPTINEDGTVTLSGTYSDVGTLDTHTLTINWGEGAPQVVALSGGTFSVTHQYLDDNPTGTASDNYIIGVTLRDDDGGTATGSKTVTVNNVAPVLGTLTVVTPESGDTFSLTGTFTDAGKSDTHAAMINWGDGTAAAPAVITESNGVGTINATHVYGAGTVFTVTVTLLDDDTGTAIGTTKAFNYYVGPQLIAVSRYISITSSAIDWISPAGVVLWSIPVPSPSVFGSPTVAGVTDRNGDGYADVYIGSQAGLLNRVGLVDGKTGALLWDVAPFASTLKLAVNVAVGDLTGDRKPELVVAPAGAGTPNVRAFQQTAGSPTFAFNKIRDFYAYASTFTGGVNVAVGDVNGDGLGDIITGTAANSDNVRVFSAGVSGSMIADYFAFNRTGVIPGYIGGVSVAAGDVNGDNYADVITSTQTQYSRVRVYSGGVNAGLGNVPNTLLLDYTTFAANIGVLVMARDLNGDGKAEVVTLTQTTSSVLINAYGYTGTLAPSTVMTKTYNYKPSGVRLG